MHKNNGWVVRLTIGVDGQVHVVRMDDAMGLELFVGCCLGHGGQALVGVVKIQDYTVFITALQYRLGQSN
ncbi:hypothetical protein GCM10007875_15170 [Limnobacter litoralis]|uniref:Transposase n=1 Tax=Limnobacter litoralis TaxID=481366 RepID=A0ABQ5YQS7_9BURK|nr:hypothetical protein GCM10007875_15170 [Limnobacter litoralis]